MTDSTPRVITREEQTQLRAPFPDAEIGKLPRVWCPACRDAIKTRRGKACEQHRVINCQLCHQKHTDGALHLDYVGHAETTDRLLSVDPTWAWAPMAVDERGLPQFDETGGLWIYLTVCGQTRIGYGTADKTGGDAVKEVIGDAIRNAAMRFGVALDLWRRTEHQDEPAEAEPIGHGRAQRAPRSRAKAAPTAAPAAETPTDAVARFEQRMNAADSVDTLVEVAREVSQSKQLADAEKTYLHAVYDEQMDKLSDAA